MTKVISFLNRKGGCGKTTTSVNTAKVLTAKGFSVTLIETDRNTPTSVVQMTETFPNNPQTFAITHAQHRNAIRIIEQMKKERARDYLVIDGAAEMDKETLCGIAQLSDLVLIPTNTTPIEINATQLTLGDIASVRTKLRVCILPTRIHWSMHQDTVVNELAQLKTPVLPSIVSWKELTYLNINHPAERIFRTFTNRIVKILEDNTARYDFATENRNTPEVREAKHLKRCGYSKCDINDGFFYARSAKANFCCDVHKTLAWREQLHKKTAQEILAT